MTIDTKDPRTLDAVNGHRATSLVDFFASQDKTDSNDSVDETDSTSNDVDDAEESDTHQDTGTESDTADTTDEDIEASDKKAAQAAFGDDTEIDLGDKGKVKVKDLKNAYETREEISRRFAEVGNKEKKVKADAEKNKQERKELDYINEKFEEMHEQILAGNHLGAMQILVSMRFNDKEPAADSAEMLQKMIKQSEDLAEMWNNLDDEGKKQFIKTKELEDKERKITKAEKKQAADRAKQELKEYYESVMDTIKATEDEMDLAYEDITKIPELKEKLLSYDEKGRIKYCGQYVLGKRIRSTVEQGIAKVRPGAEKDEKFILAVLDVIDVNCTVDSVAQLVEDSMKLAKEKSANSGKSGASTQSVEPDKKTGTSTTSNRAPTGQPKKAEKEELPVIKDFKDLVAKYSN